MMCIFAQNYRASSKMCSLLNQELCMDVGQIIGPSL